MLRCDLLGAVSGNMSQTKSQTVLRRVSDLRDSRKKKGKMPILAAKSRRLNASNKDN